MEWAYACETQNMKKEKPKDIERLLCINCLSELDPHTMIEVGLEHRKRKICSNCKKRREVIVCFDVKPPASPPREKDEKMVCPNCGEEIEYVQYATEVTEFGTYDPISEEWNHDDTNGSGMYEYTCPDCGEEIGTTQVNEWSSR
jgi:predicted RNA-binding Zn-ribbon protein involved in translation (DUF1610 family)